MTTRCIKSGLGVRIRARASAGVRVGTGRLGLGWEQAGWGEGGNRRVGVRGLKEDFECGYA